MADLDDMAMDNSTATIHVEIVEARGLKDMNVIQIGQLDSFVTLQGGLNKYSTNVVQDSTSPAFGQTFS
jgi:hypothetical protein